MVKRREALAIYVSSILLGALLQGSLMKRAVVNASLCVLGTATAVSAIPSVMGIPLSLNFALYTSQIGCGLREGAMLTSLVMTCAAWAVAIAACFALSILIQKVISERLSKVRTLGRFLTSYRTLLITLSLLMSFVVGANTFGFLISFAKKSFDEILVLTSIVLGSVSFYRKSLERFAFGFFRIGLSHATTCLVTSVVLVEVATLLSVPMPASLVSTTSIYASGFVAPYRILRSRNYLSYLLTQVISIPLALAFGFALSYAK